MPHEWRYNIRPSFLHHLDLCSKAFHRTMVHGTSTFDLRIEFSIFFPVILYIGLHPQHTFYGLYYLQFSLLIIIFTASQVFDRFWGHVPAGVAFSANIYLYIYRSSNQSFHLLFTGIQNLFKHVTHGKEMI